MAPKRPIETIVLSSDDDEDTQPQPPPSTRSTRGIELGGDDRATEEEAAFERELQQAKALSLTQQSATTRANGTGSSSEGPNTSQPRLPSRAEMEKERLERQAKRVANGGIPSTSAGGGGGGANPLSSAAVTTTSRPKINTLSTIGCPSSNDRFQRLSSSTKHNPSFVPPSASTSSDATTQRFWEGAIRRVPNLYHPDSTSLSFSSLIGPPSTLIGSIVSAFCLDPMWVVPQFPLEAPLLLIMPRAKGDDLPDLAIVTVGEKENCYRVIPKKNSPSDWGVMHTKLLVYFHETFCRIVIPTANAVDYDWSHIDNAFYVHDFPLISSTSSIETDPMKNPTHTQFSKNFCQVLVKLGTPKKFVGFSKSYDFSSSGEVRLVHSLQGKYTEGDKYDAGGGMASLAKSVASLGFAKGGSWEIEATGSSIGKYYPTWLTQFLASASGIHPTEYFTPSLTRKASTLPPAMSLPPKGTRLTHSNFPLKIIFPTHSEIETTFNGRGGGGTIFCKSSNWDDKSFPRELFCKGQSKRDRIAAHTKLILATHKLPSSLSVHEGWLYIGSHNLTPSAWGKLQTSGLGDRQLVVENYELGVVLPIRAKSKEEFERKANELVTYKRPLEPYSSTDKPWRQDQYPELFSFATPKN